jgi:branched-chain amino acid transport system permease protein
MTPPEAADARGWIRRQSRWSPHEVVFWLLMLTPFVVFPTYLPLANQIAITALFALSVDLILGYAGIVTMGHALFFGLGAYGAGILAIRTGWSEPLTGMLFGGLVAAAAGYVSSFLIVRVQHLALLMVTMGMNLLAYKLAEKLSWLTGGTDGLLGSRPWPLLGYFRFDLWGNTAYGYSLAVLFVAFLCCRRLVNSSFGLSLRGARENLRRMPAIGADYAAHLRKVYVISAGLAGLAGALLAQSTATVGIEAISFLRSADVLVMLILGGTGRLYGAMFGTIIFMLARDRLADINPEYWQLGIGLLLMVVVLFMPRGILGFVSRLSGRRQP